MPPNWVRIAVGGGATMLVGMGLGRFSYTPMMPALIADGGFAASEAGYVAAFNLAGYLVGAVTAPLLRGRLGELPALRFSLVISLLCLAMSILPWGFAWLAFWRFLVGMAVAVMMIYSLSVVTRFAPPQRLGAATGIVFTGVGIGILLSGTLVSALLQSGIAIAWTGLAGIGALGVAVAFWGWHGVEGGVRSDRAPPTQGGRVRITPAIARLIASQTLFTLGLAPYTIYWVDYLVRGLGHGFGVGGFHWALFGLGAVSGTYLWGRLADRIGFRVGMILAYGALALGIAAPVLLPAAWVLVLSSLVVGAQPGFSAILSGRTHQTVGPQHMPIVWRWMALTAGIFQAVGGYVYVTVFTVTESYVPIFLAGGAAMAVGMLISLPRGAKTAAQ